jgi:monoterpene epsilon-lactone hydrolase
MSDGIDALNAEDPILGLTGLRKAAKAYAGNLDLNNPMVSPINGIHENLGRISLFIGTKDSLVIDARRYQSILINQDIPMDYFEYEDMVHDWMLLPLPEGKQAVSEIIRLIKE